MKKTDTCYYLSITKEENSSFVVANQNNVNSNNSANNNNVEKKTAAGKCDGGYPFSSFSPQPLCL